MDEKELTDVYATLLALFFEGREEESFFQVSELGKRMVMERVGPDVLLDVHSRAVKEMVTEWDAQDMARMLVASNDVLLNGIMAYAMNYYNFLDLLDAEKSRLQEARTELEKANERLRQLDRLKSLFIATMSHELRTPLNSIIGFTGVILQGMSGPINEEQRDQLGRVYRAANHLLSLITDVIDVSKIEAGEVQAHVSPFLLEELVQEALAMVREEAEAKGLSLETEVPECMTLQTDRRRLLQCLLNYLGNAVKFTDSGSVRVEAEDSGDGLLLWVRDTGPGIPEEDLPRLFAPFERLQTGPQDRKQGTGLGLYLTRKIASDILAGETMVRSGKGAGSAFGILIPKRLEGPGSGFG